jgi:hypothetical protein
MDQDSQQNLFEIKLDETGKSHIRKSFKLIGLVAISLVIGATAMVVIQVKRIIRDSEINYPGFWDNIVIKALPWLAIFMTAVNVIAVYFYVRFFNKLSLSIRSNSQVLFNESFKYLYQNLIFWLSVMAISFIMDAISLYLVFKYS